MDYLTMRERTACYSENSTHGVAQVGIYPLTWLHYGNP